MAAAAAGRPAVLAIDGEPGIGKTSLVRWAVAASPWRAVVVSGDEAEIDLEWGVVDQLLRSDPTPAPDGGRSDRPAPTRRGRARSWPSARWPRR